MVGIGERPVAGLTKRSLKPWCGSTSAFEMPSSASRVFANG